jgi:hypothetical protein
MLIQVFLNLYLILELLVNKKDRSVQKFFEPLFTLFDICIDMSKS